MKLHKTLLFVLGLLPLWAFAQLNVRVEDAYSREMPPSAENIAIYMTIKNVGSHDVSLRNIRSDDAASVSVHRTVMDEGMMSMQPIEALDIPPRESVRMEPGGLHIMLMGVRRPMRAGDSARLFLEFSNNVVLRVDVPILDR